MDPSESDDLIEWLQSTEHGFMEDPLNWWDICVCRLDRHNSIHVDPSYHNWGV